MLSYVDLCRFRNMLLSNNGKNNGTVIEDTGTDMLCGAFSLVAYSATGLLATGLAWPADRKFLGE